MSMSNGQVIYYLNCKKCNEKETFWENKRRQYNNTKRFKVGINQRISDCKTVDSTCKFLHHIYDCGIKNNCLEELFINLNMLSNKNDRLETIEKHFHLKVYIYIAPVCLPYSQLLATIKGAAAITEFSTRRSLGAS